MKKLLSLALLATTPALFGMVDPAPKMAQSGPTWMDHYLPADLHRAYIVPMLLQGDDFSTVTLNVACYLKTLTREFTPDQIRTIADAIAARFMPEFESRHAEVTTGTHSVSLNVLTNSANLFPTIVACFAICGIPGAKELLADTLEKPAKLRLLTCLTFDEAQNTLLMLAIDGNLDAVAMNYEMLRPLIATFSMNRDLALRALAMFNVDIRANIHGETALIKAVKKGDCEAVQILLESNADTRIADLAGNTALSYALSSGNMRLQNIFEQHEAKKLNLLTNFGSTPLIDATRCADDETIISLIGQGADAFVQDIDGKSALDYARGNTRLKTIFAKALNVEVEALFPR